MLRPGNVKDFWDRKASTAGTSPTLPTAEAAVTAHAGFIGSTVRSTGRPGRTVRRDALR